MYIICFRGGYILFIQKSDKLKWAGVGLIISYIYVYQDGGKRKEDTFSTPTQSHCRQVRHPPPVASSKANAATCMIQCHVIFYLHVVLKNLSSI